MPAPVTPDATPAACDLLDLLYRLTGRATLAGQHNQPIHGSQWTERMTALGGGAPAVWGQEIGFSAPGTKDAIDRRAANAAEAVAWHRRGAVITYTWHSVCPPDDEPVDFGGGILRPLDPAEYDAVLEPGSALHARWQSQVDTVATGPLGALAAAGVPVLWRPYHEMNGPWFWWGGEPERSVRLWRQLYDRLARHHGMRNLIWVWSPNAAYESATAFAPYFPATTSSTRSPWTPTTATTRPSTTRTCWTWPAAARWASASAARCPARRCSPSSPDGAGGCPGRTR